MLSIVCFQFFFGCTYIKFEIKKNMHLLDGSFMSGIKPYVDIDSVMKHPLWGSNLLFNNEQAVINSHKDYIRGNCLIMKQIQFILTLFQLQF